MKNGLSVSLARGVKSPTAAPVVITPTTLDPAQLWKTSLFSGNNEARITTPLPYGDTFGSARSAVSKTSGKYYVEIYINFDNVPSGGYSGVALNTLTPEQSANSLSWLYRMSAGGGRTIRIAVDFDSGKLWATNALDGSFLGDPVAGTNPSKTWTPGSPYAIFVSPYTTADSYGTLEARLTARFDPAVQINPAPTGYGVWGS